MKKILFLLICMCIPWSAWAEAIEIDGIYYNLVEKAKQAEVTYGPDGGGAYTGDIVIPESIEYNGNSYAVTSIAKNAFQYSSISSIEIPNSITSIGDDAFFNSNGLTSVTIPSSVKSIGSYAFYSCGNLSSVDIQYGLTNIGYYAFAYCHKLADVNIPSSVTNIEGGTFSNCTGLHSFTIPTGINSVSSSMFEGCTNLQTIVIPDNINTIGSATFKNCSSLTSVILGAGVQTIFDEAFSECKNLETVYCHVQNVPWTSENAFADSYIDYATLVVPMEALENYQSSTPWSNFGTIKAFTDIAETYPIYIDGIYYQLFADGTAKVVSGEMPYRGDISIPSSVNFEGVDYVVTTIGYGAFNAQISSVDIPESVTTIEESAFICSYLTSIHIPANVSFIGRGAFSALNAQVESITVDENNPYFDSRNGCNAIINTATNELVRGCKNTVIPADVTSIGYEAFGWCYELTNIQIPESVTSIDENAFIHCWALESIQIPESVTTIGNQAFSYSGLKSITIPSNVTSIGERAFEGCEGLSFITMEASEPLAVAEGTFPANALLYVPTGSREAYVAAEGWNSVKKILEMAAISNDVSYYMLNVETGLFLNQGNSWGTRAVLAEEGLPVRFTQLEDGTYTIYFEEGSGYDRLLFRENETNVYVDYNPNNSSAANWCQYWTVTKGDDDNYYLQSSIADGRYGQVVYPGTFLGNNPTKEAYDQNGNALGVYNDVDGNVMDEEGMNVKWKLITPLAYNLRVHELPMVIASANEVGIDTSEALSVQQSKSAGLLALLRTINGLRQAINEQLAHCDGARNNPINVTGLLRNPSFAWNSDYGWTASEALEDGTHTLRVGACEYWNTSFNYSQSITGLANGIYQIKVKAFHRPGNNWDVLNDYQQGIDNANAMLEANNSSMVILNQASAALNEQVNGWGTEVNGMYVPNSMEGAKQWFDAGYYENTLTVNVTDGTLDLRIRLDDEIADQWVIFDDFELYYLGSQNQLYAEEAAARAGTDVFIPVVLANETEFGGLQCVVTLPEGATLTGTSKGDRLGKDFTVFHNSINDNQYQIVVMNFARQSFLGNDGELFGLTVHLSDEMEVGDYEIQLTDITASSIDLYQEDFADSRSVLHVEDFLIGDVNMDGRVNVTDAMCVINNILGHEMSVFNKKAADVYVDGRINVTDVMGIINIILTGNSTSNHAPLRHMGDPQ